MRDSKFKHASNFEQGGILIPQRSRLSGISRVVMKMKPDIIDALFFGSMYEFIALNRETFVLDSLRVFTYWSKIPGHAL